ncbi:LOW QUALITY PROTEIN: hypothetical protein KIPB_001910, partial [Kipferlia bialata]
ISAAIIGLCKPISVEDDRADQDDIPLEFDEEAPFLYWEGDRTRRPIQRNNNVPVDRILRGMEKDHQFVKRHILNDLDSMDKGEGLDVNGVVESQSSIPSERAIATYRDFTRRPNDSPSIRLIGSINSDRCPEEKPPPEIAPLSEGVDVTEALHQRKREREAERERERERERRACANAKRDRLAEEEREREKHKFNPIAVLDWTKQVSFRRAMGSVRGEKQEAAEDDSAASSPETEEQAKEQQRERDREREAEEERERERVAEEERERVAKEKKPKKVWRLHLSLSQYGKWTTHRPLPIARCFSLAVCAGPWVYLVGGQGGTETPVYKCHASRGVCRRVSGCPYLSPGSSILGCQTSPTSALLLDRGMAVLGVHMALSGFVGIKHVLSSAHLRGAACTLHCPPTAVVSHISLGLNRHPLLASPFLWVMLAYLVARLDDPLCHSVFRDSLAPGRRLRHHRGMSNKTPTKMLAMFRHLQRSASSLRVPLLEPSCSAHVSVWECVIQVWRVCVHMCSYTALCCRETGALVESLNLLREAQTLHPSGAQATLQIARVLYLLGDYPSAYQYLSAQADKEEEDGFSQKGLHWVTQHNLGLTLIRLNRLEDAVEAFETANDLHPNYETKIKLARCLAKLGRDTEAVQAYKDVLAFAPQSAEVLSALGVLYLNAANQTEDSDTASTAHADAFDAFSRSLMVNPEHPGARLGNASVHQRTGDVEVALVKYRSVYKQRPDAPELWSNLGLCFLEHNRQAEALACTRRAYVLRPADYRIRYNLGLVLLSLDKPASAFRCLSGAVSLNPGNASAYWLMAVALAKLKDKKNTPGAYAKALQLGAGRACRLDAAISLCNLGLYDLAGGHFDIYARGEDQELGDTDSLSQEEAAHKVQVILTKHMEEKRRREIARSLSENSPEATSDSVDSVVAQDKEEAGSVEEE